jgi:transcription initiation factor TFIIIB Brf1 subunit/transcription initiation factor TFIIB
MSYEEFSVDNWSFHKSFADDSSSEEDDEDVCLHQEIIKIDTEDVCKECGCIVEQLDFSFDKNDEGNRCQYKTKNARTIDDVFSRNGVQIPEMLMDMGEQKYKVVVNSEKVRGKDRDALVAVCLLFCLRKLGDKKTVDDMRRTFNVSRKKISCSLSKYYRHFPLDRIGYLYPEDLIKRTLELQDVDLKYTFSIQKLCTIIKGKSKTLNRSTPQSIATTMTYLYLKNRPDIPEEIKDKKLFSKKAFISEITIDKILKEVCSLLGIAQENEPRGRGRRSRKK